MEAAYILVQEHLLEGLSALKEECRTSVRQLEVLIHSDMDQILNSRRQLEEKVRGASADRSLRLSIAPLIRRRDRWIQVASGNNGFPFPSAAKVSGPAEKLCSESVQPYLGSVLEELMGPISSGFLEGRQLSENMMDRVCQDVLVGGENEQLKTVGSDL